MELTKEQLAALKEIYNRDSSVAADFTAFLKTVTPGFGLDSHVMVPFNGIWLGVEADGYTHS